MGTSEQLTSSFIPCRWRTGFVSSERIVEFRIRDEFYSAIVGEKDVVAREGQEDTEGMTPGWLRVYIVDEKEDSLLVDLPRETPVGRRFFIPPTLLEQPT